MASGFFAILDDIAALMDDVATMGKLATKKTAGILGDDLAVNAEKATGFVASREIPVLWAITKGSLINKVIIIPIALLLNFFFPFAIKVILVLGGLYLAYEGAEKIVEFLFHRHPKVKQNDESGGTDAAVMEKAKVKAAVTTDFILSIEIVIIALGTVMDKELMIQIVVVSVVALLATVGVYGIVALIVRMDDFGWMLKRRSNNKGIIAKLGQGLINLLPWIIKALGVIGTIALLLVAGGIFVHNSEFLHHSLPFVPSFIKEISMGLAAGLLVVGAVLIIKKIMRKPVE
ncbi:MAG TPA: DUF808 domain-containing protein [Saprospirales bacterium]|nr:DUF808 domain-containing protein [Saprospirales bacterium]